MKISYATAGKAFFCPWHGTCYIPYAHKNGFVARARELDICNQTSKPEDAHKKKKNNN